MENRQRYTVADLNRDQLEAVERLENQLGLTLIAYEPAEGAARAGAGHEPPGWNQERWAAPRADTPRR